MHCKVLIAALLIVGAGQSRAETRQEPLWEFGLGIGVTAFQDYPGSDTTRVYPIPIPYFVYNGEFLKSDKNGPRGLLINQEWLELNLSGDINSIVPHDEARYGMPELRPTIEIGPAVIFHLINRDEGRLKLDLQVPVRAAFTIASSPQSIGWIGDPRLILKVKDTFGMHGWETDLSSGPMFIDKKYSDYYYSVAPQYATTARPAYTAPGGYSGTQFEVTLHEAVFEHLVRGLPSLRHASRCGVLGQSAGTKGLRLVGGIRLCVDTREIDAPGRSNQLTDYMV